MINNSVVYDMTGVQELPRTRASVDINKRAECTVV